MGGALIAVALLVVMVLSVPVPMWAARVSASFRRRRRTPATDALGDAHALRPGLRRLLVAGRQARELIDALGPVAADYRRTLPYLNLFFADVRTCLDARSARWVVLARQDYELAVTDVARLLEGWCDGLAKLDEAERAVIDSAGGGPTSIAALLDDGSRLPRTAMDAQRLRFCEAWEVERLEDSLVRIAEDLARLEHAVLDARIGPYR